MGLIFSKIFSALFGQKDLRILILGLDNAGKTTILYKLHFNEVIQTIPTIGFNVETVVYKNLKFQVWDLGGQAGIRSYWRSYYPCTNAVIFVIDSNDRDRLSTTKQELSIILEEEDLKSVPILILANKQDLVNVMTETEITEYLELTRIKTRPWAIFKCSAKTGYGLNDGQLPQQHLFKLNKGMEWLVSSLKQ